MLNRYGVFVRGALVGWRDNGGMDRAREAMAEAGITRAQIVTIEAVVEPAGFLLSELEGAFLLTSEVAQ